MFKEPANYYFDKDKIDNLKTLFDLREKETGEETIIKYMVKRNVVEVSGNQFFSDLKRKAAFLYEQNLTGKKIAIIGKNSYEWFVTFSAIVYVGSATVLLSKDFNSSEIKEYSLKTDVEAVIYDSDLTETVKDAELMENLSLIAMEKAYSDQTYVMSDICVERNKEDLACILFTSGTTGKSKAVMLSHKALISDFTVILKEGAIDSQLSTLPFHHLAGFNVAFTTLFNRCVVCIGETPTLIFRYLEKMKPQCTFVVPVLLDMIREKMLKYTKEDLPWDIRCISCGGAKFPKEYLEAFADYGIDIWQIYAASETGGHGLLLLMDMDHLDALGKAGPGMEAGIIDGELVIRGDTIMMGYYGEPELSAEVLADGWYHSGDLCSVDEEGYFYLTGRKKNLIILSNGENISPEEIENSLSECEDIAELVVFEEKDRLAVEIYPLFTDECVDEKEMQAKIAAYVDEYNKTVPSYKQIVYVHFRNTEFEKTSVGKIKRQR